jgi:uncharacterized surface protein with fasciclin (FAS1) repeats
MQIRHLLPVLLAASVIACASGDSAEYADDTAAPASGGQASVVDETSMPDIVKVAVGSPDHTTLVAALQAADLVNSLANPGPFTVFAPTDEAFAKLPAGTVEDLVKPENKATLVKILYHHVTTSALDVDMFDDGMDLGMVEGRVMIKKENGEMWVDGAKVIASVRASNGWVHVIDAVLVPKSE